MHYGPMIPDYVNSYHSHVYQPVGVNQYEQIMQQPAKIGESYTMFEVVPDEEELGYGINQGKSSILKLKCRIFNLILLIF